MSGLLAHVNTEITSTPAEQPCCGDLLQSKRKLLKLG